ncbi:MAG: alpha/beta hydrolase [Chitinophagaceae bacterium]|nr:alpha/beta hydrolase [Chitinophagaceae bacterium]
MRFLKFLGILIVLFIVVYFFGPQPNSPKLAVTLPELPQQPAELEGFIRSQEAAHRLRPDNEARIVWLNDSTREMTEYAVVYLHGFSASQEEGDPVHLNFAKKFGCNLYLSRLAEHGIDTSEQLLNMTADNLWESAKQAYAIGKRLGKKVILMSTSTGGTLALKLAAEYPEIHSLLLLSPNIEINDPNAWLLNNHWGLQIARAVQGKYNVPKDTSRLYKQYWNTPYRMEAAVQLEELLETTMKKSTFERVKQPTLLLYYFKDEDHQDEVVKVSAMKRMFRQLSTPDSLKRAVPIPGAGDHVLGSYIKSKDVAAVERECERFAREVLGM